jgi:hypothetical protein
MAPSIFFSSQLTSYWSIISYISVEIILVNELLPEISFLVVAHIFGDALSRISVRSPVGLVVGLDRHSQEFDLPSLLPRFFIFIKSVALSVTFKVSC